HKGLLSAGEQGDGLEGLPRRLRLDLNAAVQDILRVLQLQRSFSSTKKLHEGGLKSAVDQLELLIKNICHFPGDFINDTCQFSFGALHIVSLVCKIGISSINPFKFLDRPHIYIAKASDLP